MATCPECRSSYADDVQKCPADGATLVPDGLLPEESSLTPGTMVGEYRIDRRLGSGTFGDVYAGEHPLIGKRVAVKVLNRRFASDPEMVSRFIAEARAVNKIRQRNIIDIFSFGVLGDKQQHYFVMELLDGLTLGQLLDQRGHLPVPMVLSITQGIADALDAVHEAGITHRDLKPDNVFLGRERDGSFFPKLLDFGIAKLIDDDVAHKTGPGVVMGTPRYMSPEQSRGKKADPLSDVYALGVMIHEMLTGQAPFVGESAVDVLVMHTTDTPPSVSSIRPDLPRELDAPVLRMLAKRPKDRPATAGQAVAELREVAHKLGLDKQDPPAPRAPSLADRAEQSDKDTFTLDGDRRVVSEASTVAHAATPVTQQSPDGLTPAATTPIRARAAFPAAAVRRHADAPTLVATSLPAGDGRESGPPSEQSSSLDTASEITRSERARRLKIGVGAVVAIAGLASLFALRHSAAGPRPDTSTSGLVMAPTTTAPITPSPSSSIDPTVTAAPSDGIVLHLATRPSDVEVWLGPRKLGSSADALAVPRGPGKVELKLKKTGFKDGSVELTPDHDQSLDASLAPIAASGAAVRTAPTGKPAASAGKLDRIFGDRE